MRTINTVHEAIAHADAILPGHAPEGERDPRWQAVGAVAEFIETEPEAVWSFILRWGISEDADLRMAIATCALEHLLQHHFDAFISRVEETAYQNGLFARTVSSCWKYGQSEEPSRAARLDRLNASLAAVGSQRVGQGRRMAFCIRDAREDDVPALARLHVQTFTETHRAGQPGGPSHELRERQWREAFTVADGSWFCFVVEGATGELVGFAKGTAHDGGVPGFAGELNKIYLLLRLHRQGVGRFLLCNVARRFIERGVTSMLLFGEAANPSNGFYEALGAERLCSPTGEFHGGYGWRDLQSLVTRCCIV